ncbi:carotenoid biosynthesis protein [Paenibacillus aurantius]|uniref:Carotenoid biosynthesis protein n=1 Tax=Paenibacillus aurantius TaxID=2918900 RepID=A0AA96LDC8_9BACL|nr:carotenoid biosynthesis protein [Paenibacillus aurantius]WNQ10021.1 carotenoid biosynthesis protein [Paenibacillus aurantius]
MAAVSRAPGPAAGRPESGGQRGGGEPAGKASFPPGFTKAGLAARVIRPVFWFWYAAGLLLMLFYKVPEALGFSNGLFLLFFASYAVFLETRTGRGIPGIVFRTTLVAAVTFGVEAMGVATGFPFGSYAYTDVLGIAAGGVPLAIACAWIGVMVTMLLLAEDGPRWVRALQVGGGLLLFDLVLDPVAYARGFWVWEGTGVYAGIPWTNFASWFLIAALLSFVYPRRTVPAPVRREAGLLYGLMLVMFALLGIKEGMLLPAGFAAVGLLLVYGRVQRKEGSAR